MNIKGNTLFLGDSMSVALAPAVSVDGTKRTIAQVSKTSAWLKSQVTPADFQGVDNVFLLIGANDIGQANPGITLSNIAAIRAMAPPSVKFFVMTIPPFKGWKNYESQYSTINARRLEVNKGIRSTYGTSVVDLDKLLASPSDPEALASFADSGDHLHPRPKSIAAAIESTVSHQPPTPTKAQIASESPSGLGTALVISGVSLLFYLATRRK